MAEKISVKKLAKELGLSVDALLKQFKAANMRVTGADQDVSANQKTKIEAFLKKEKTESKPAFPEEKPIKTEEDQHAQKPKKMSLTTQTRPDKITLQRKTKSTLQVTGSQSRAPKTVNVEVRKKHTYIKRSLLDQEKAKTEEPKQKEKPIPEKVEPKAEGVIEKPAEKPTDQYPEIDKSIVSANLEREKRLERLSVAEQEMEGAKAKKKAQARQTEKERARKKIDLRTIDLDEELDLKETEVDFSEKIRKKAFKPQEFSALKIKKQLFEKPAEPIMHEVMIPEVISVSELAQRMAIKAPEVIKTLIKMGTMVTINQMIDQDTAAIVVETMGHKPKIISDNILEESLLEGLKSEAKAIHRAPVVTIMGHVDHGKTKLLDCIRQTKIAEGEAGGITQHIGAYHVQTDKGIVTFLDTPGHEAFTAMRSRGVQTTDIVVLVVAADDGVMPQTIEAIQHAKAAEVPIIVAINKIDKPEADPERVRTELSQHNVIPEEWGGDVMFINISAKEALGIDALLDAILLQAEMLELKAVKEAPARGVIVESRLDTKRGAVATVLVQQGTLHTGDIILAGVQYGRIRAMLNEVGHKVTEAGPSIPVEVLGLPGTPMAGDEFMVVHDERKAREVALFRQSKFRDTLLSHRQPITLENLFTNVEKDKINTLNIVLKTDVQGSLEALKDSLLNLSTDEVQVKIISSGVGGITESDINLAVASNAIIVGFNVRADLAAKRLIEKTDVDVRYYSVIYDIVNEVKSALSGLLAPEIKEKIIGLAEVREVFRSSKFGTIAGCMVIDGLIKRNKPVRVLRDNIVIFEGEIDSLRRFKEDVTEVRQNMECGIGIKNYTDIKEKDQIEVFDRIKVERKL